MHAAAVDENEGMRSSATAGRTTEIINQAGGRGDSRPGQRFRVYFLCLGWQAAAIFYLKIMALPVPALLLPQNYEAASSTGG
jgi:hypothetical protein